MPFEKGNKLWALAQRPTGKPRKFKGAKELLDAAIAYFEWAAENPLEETVVGWYQGEASEHTVYHPRALTIKGFAAHAQFSHTMWSAWKQGETRDPNVEPYAMAPRTDIAIAQEWIENVMFEQKFSGAAAGLFNAGLVMRDLGLADKNEHLGKDGGPLQVIIQGADAEL